MNIDINLIKKRAKRIRRLIVETGYNSPAGASHLGGALSCVDFLACLPEFWRIGSEQDSKHCRITLSKGHACLALYSFLHEQSVITKDDLNSFDQNGSYFAGHPIRDVNKQIYFSTGSLGIGVSNAIGQALYFQNKLGINSPKFCCILGDGECAEGIVYESLRFAASQNLKNLIVFIDINNCQQTGCYDQIVPNLTPKDLCKNLGVNHFHLTNGNSPSEIVDVIYRNTKIEQESLLLITADTIKGFGVDFMENDNKWHHSAMSPDQYKSALNQIDKL